MIFNLFGSRTEGQARDMLKHVRKILDAQRDILSPQAVDNVESAAANLRQALAEKPGDEALKKRVGELETAANKWLKPYPNAGIRENVEVLLVALAVAMAIRTFFVQPFKIPTGSMQPTLFGITSSTQFGTNDYNLKIPGAPRRWFESLVLGTSYYNIVAPEDGALQRVLPPVKFLIFNLKQDYVFNNKSYTVWLPGEDLFVRAGYRWTYDGNVVEPPMLKAGDPIVRLKSVAGDHLFVDRVTYNFRPPKRGEIIVFETTGIPTLPQGQFYIKRLVALGGERVQIGEDRHLIIDGKRLDQNTPHFEKVYSFNPNEEPRESHYSGHVGPPKYAYLAPLFVENPDGYVVRPEHYMVMGDNTMNSSDSRFWGDFSRTNVIGKYLFVYWPFSDRFGFKAR